MTTAAKAKSKVRIQPLEDRVVIMPSEETETMRGGLYIPDTAKEKPTQGEVFGRFAKLMAPEGFLYIGHSENLGTGGDGFRLVGKTIYQAKEKLNKRAA